MNGTHIKEKSKDRLVQALIRSKANYSLAVLGRAFVRNGSGRFLNIRTAGDLQLVKRAAR
jgi:hypothetical protein